MFLIFNGQVIPEITGFAMSVRAAGLVIVQSGSFG